MLLLILFFTHIAVILAANLLLITDYPQKTIVFYWVIGVLGEIAISGLAAFVCGKVLPSQMFEGDKKLFRVSKRERAFYEKMGVKKWKDRVLELGALNGFRKNKVDNLSPEYLSRFITEGNRGAVNHLLSAFAGFFLLFAFPKTLILSIGLPSAYVNALLNLMPFAVLRYNVPRLAAAKKYALKRETEKEQEKKVQPLNQINEPNGRVGDTAA